MPGIDRRTVMGVLVAGVAAALTEVRAAPARALASLGDEFMWGVASSGFQSEGHTPDSHQRRFFTQQSEFADHPDSVDFFTRYPGDIGLARDLGVGVYRISIEWARLQPRPEVWDEAGFEYYERVLDAMVAAGIRPMITLDHWVYPVWIAARGGWRDPGIVAAWLANAQRVVDRFAVYDPLWITVAVPAGYIKYEVQGGLSGLEVPGVAARMVQVHNAIYDHIHARQPGAQVTMSTNVALGALEDVTNTLVLDRVVDRLDFVGVGNYVSFSLDTLPGLLAHGLLAPQDLSSVLAHAMQPESIYYALRYCARRFPGKQLYVVDNGIPTWNGVRVDGYGRADHLLDTVYWIQRARAEGIAVVGYNYWGLTDSFEWGSYGLRYGLYSVDVKTDPTLTRRPTDAVPAYRKITSTGGVPADYLPTRQPAMCSFVDTPDSCVAPVVPR